MTALLAKAGHAGNCYYSGWAAAFALAAAFVAGIALIGFLAWLASR